MQTFFITVRSGSRSSSMAGKFLDAVGSFIHIAESGMYVILEFMFDNFIVIHVSLFIYFTVVN